MQGGRAGGETQPLSALVLTVAGWLLRAGRRFGIAASMVRSPRIPRRLDGPTTAACMYTVRNISFARECRHSWQLPETSAEHRRVRKTNVRL